jgi:hypothetical protein
MRQRYDCFGKPHPESDANKTGFELIYINKKTVIQGCDSPEI